MALRNTNTTYGAVAKTFHWLTALLILSAIPLGIIASNLAHGLEDPSATPDEATITLTATLFSLHKTIGVTVFLVALARIAWALGQPKPGLLNGDNAPEAWLAETVHWLLYGSLVAVPLSGWVHHAATTGFAPIWWPFGQSLPFVPKDPGLAELTGVLHYVLQWILLGAIGLHIAGALKHHVIDRDATLRRMLPGHAPAEPTAQQPNHALPFVTALAIWAMALGGASTLGWFSGKHAATDAPAALAEVESDWQVQEGTLALSVQQLGSAVTGQFADWTADITYDETPDSAGKHGAVEVTIATSSLSLGSVTDQAKGAGYLDTGTHPTAVFAADLIARDGGHVATGTLTIRDQSVPVEMPFKLNIENDTATASGSLSVDRRDFGIGADVKDEGSLGFAVEVSFELTATR
ncbi:MULTISPECIES: cytochrome b/b6 domain-containing protein [unclassified Roseovarius]|uniref:cytochrome b/b6 domain-containing protein n=1 Tax=unclassified Roseovarius TaxID=2614913 RepID=UPI00273D2FED|nr:MULTISPECIES: cytochrome b/b6 domain-containing protein [unclassified Roseovarius]